MNCGLLRFALTAAIPALSLACLSALAPATAQEADEASNPPYAEAQAQTPVGEDPASGESAPTGDSQAIAEEPAAAPPDEVIPESQPEDVAATNDATELDTITVSASKRLKSQRDIPGSVGAVRGDDLEKIKAQGLADYVKQVPGLVLIERGVDGGIPIIRGVATNTTFSIYQSLNVGIYVDDMPFTDLYLPTAQPDLNPFDLERVEILKGPQGTLFGSGALSGAIRYILQKPKPLIWETKLSGTYATNSEGDPSQIAAGALNVPVYDEAAIRLVGLYRKSGGTIDSKSRGEKNVDEVDQYTGRLLGTWQASDNLKLDGFYFLQQSDQADSPDADNPERFESGTNAFPTTRDSGLSGGNISATYGFDWGNLLSTSNYLTKNVAFVTDVPSGTSFPFGNPTGIGGDNGTGTEDSGQTPSPRYFSSDTQGLFQEFRLSSPEGGDYTPWDWLAVEWLAGAAYQHTEAHFVQDAPAPTNAPIPGVPPVPGGAPRGSRSSELIYAEAFSLATEAALYGEATAKVGEHWEVTAGLRGFKTELNSAGFAGGLLVLALDGRPEVTFDANMQADGVNPKFSLRYLFNKNVQTYALAAKGFQFGGIQVNPPIRAFTASVPGGFKNYESSKLWNYELGLRTEFFDRQLKFDTTVFYLDWKDMQIATLVPVGTTVPFVALAPFNYIVNIGSAKSQGVETALSVTPVRGLNFTTSAAWIQAVTTEDFMAPEGLIPAGTRLPGSPRFQMSNILAYDTPVSLLGNWETGANLVHSHIGSSPSNLTAFREQGGYDTLDLNLHLLKPDWGLVPDLSLSVLNLTDVRGVAAANAFAAARAVQYFLVRPRTVLVSLSLKF